MADTFETLFPRARAGDRDARDRLLADHLPGLRAFVRSQSGQALRAREGCSDLVQTVCREALADLGSVECGGPAEFQRWLYAVALHKIVRKAEYHNAAKRSLDREVPFDEASAARDLLAGYASLCSPSRNAAAHEEVARIEQALDQLPDDYRNIIVQSRIVGMSHAEIARESGRSEVAVRQLLARARAKLALALER